jgi:pyruvate,water dikinase
MNIVWFDESSTPEAVGGKGYRLSVMSQKGLPVPRGFCIPADVIDTIAFTNIDSALARLSASSVAVRSSACEEDGNDFSFAGIYKTILHLKDGPQVLNAVKEIRDSASGLAAQLYRARLGIAKLPKMAAVVQTMLRPDAAGVLFMQDPLDRANRIMIEGTWGLGESVVSGAVTPDRWLLTREGKTISVQISTKETATTAGKTGTKQTEVPKDRRRMPCLSPKDLAEIVALGRHCEQLFGSPQDLEWAVTRGKVWILQSRPITRGKTR